jgi:hypothetical protein
MMLKKYEIINPSDKCFIEGDKIVGLRDERKLPASAVEIANPLE